MSVYSLLKKSWVQPLKPNSARSGQLCLNEALVTEHNIHCTRRLGRGVFNVICVGYQAVGFDEQGFSFLQDFSHLCSTRAEEYISSSTQGLQNKALATKKSRFPGWGGLDAHLYASIANHEGSLSNVDQTTVVVKVDSQYFRRVSFTKRHRSLFLTTIGVVDLKEWRSSQESFAGARRDTGCHVYVFSPVNERIGLGTDRFIRIERNRHDLGFVAFDDCLIS